MVETTGTQDKETTHTHIAADSPRLELLVVKEDLVKAHLRPVMQDKETTHTHIAADSPRLELLVVKEDLAHTSCRVLAIDLINN